MSLVIKINKIFWLDSSCKQLSGCLTFDTFPILPLKVKSCACVLKNECLEKNDAVHFCNIKSLSTVKQKYCFSVFILRLPGFHFFWVPGWRIVSGFRVCEWGSPSRGGGPSAAGGYQRGWGTKSGCWGGPIQNPIVHG